MNTNPSQDNQDADLQEVILRTQTTFDKIVDLLRERHPRVAIRDLMTMAWRIIGNRIVPVAIYGGVVTPGFGLLSNGRGVIFLPPNWLNMYAQDPITQMGAVVFSASQAVDYFNERAATADVRERAMAYEAEFLVSLDGLRSEDPDLPPFKPTEYQQAVLEKFPHGLTSRTAAPLIYPHREFPLG